VIPLWQLWAPPLDPPVEGGLPLATAQQIAAAVGDCDPWLAAALMWETWAATLPTEAGVIQVATGSQSVTYSNPGGQFALAMARAEWLRGMRGSLASVRVRVAIEEGPPCWWELDWWQANRCETP
jgi:hypothetical protein